MIVWFTFGDAVGLGDSDFRHCMRIFQIFEGEQKGAEGRWGTRINVKV